MELSDGGEVCLDWLDCEKGKDGRHPTVLFLPGLTGDSQSEYIKVIKSIPFYGRIMPVVKVCLLIGTFFVNFSELYKCS